ncbi:hypothetical protein [Luteimonas mephitis]|nr:hypothetical protein [Luteimonas mephitis]
MTVTVTVTVTVIVIVIARDDRGASAANQPTVGLLVPQGMCALR